MWNTDKKTRNYIFLYHATKCPTTAEKIEFGGLNKTKYNRIAILNYKS